MLQTKSCKLIIKNEVSVKFEGLEPRVRSKMMRAVEYSLPHARFTPAGRLGRWDGKVSFMTVGGTSYFHVLDKLLPILDENGYRVDIVDQRQAATFEFDAIDENYFADVEFAPGHHMEGKSIVLRQHQVDCANAFLGNRHGLAVAATGAGKTLITAALSRSVEKYGRSIVIVPSQDLVTQTEEDYLLVGLDVGVFYGGRKELGKTHTICTWQSLHSLWKKTKKNDIKMDEQDIHEFLEGVACVIVDEAHTAKGEALKAVLGGVMGNIPLRWGLTGTIPKDDIAAMQMKTNIGDVIFKVNASELQDKGYLSKCDVKVVQLASKQQFGDYASELKWLVSDKKRMGYIADLIDNIANTGNTLVLVDRLDAGHAIVEHLGLQPYQFVSGSTAKKKRKDSYDSVKFADNEIIIATYGVAAVGLNIPRIFNLVLIEPGKSFVRTIQSIGRGLRRAKDKDYVQIWDIAGTNKYTARHVRERLNFYREAEYPFERLKIKDWEEDR